MEMKICKTCKVEKSIDEFYSQIIVSKIKGEYIRINLSCKKCVNERSKEWRELNVEQYNALILKRTNRHKQNFKELSRVRRLNGKYGKWQQDNPEKIKQYRLNREQNKTHVISKQEWKDCQEYFNNSCAYCGLPIAEHYIKFKGKMILGKFHKEHVNHEGSNDLSNCVPSCKTCNSSKHNFDFEEWYNESNINYSKERMNKIHKWIKEDCKLYMSSLDT